MPGDQRILAEAVSDAEDRLLEAQEPLATLQLRCGGTIPGAIAIPELRELVGKARRFGLTLARLVTAQDGAEQIRTWVEVAPQQDAAAGCEIRLRSWQTAPLAAEDDEAAAARRADIARVAAELTAQLDARQCLLAVEGEGADLAETLAAMRSGTGRAWTDFATIAGSSHHQPMHWRLLDGASVTLPGSSREWRATLIPQLVPGDEPRGFELCLCADGVMAAVSGPAPPPAPAAIGSELAPVLRQPIARIIANAETIRARLAGPVAEEYSRYAGDIAAAGQHLLELIEDLADLEVIEAAHFSTAPDHIDLADVARRAAGILGIRARERGITLQAPPEGSSLRAVAEFRRVLQVLLNLIGNAIRYSPENSAVTVALEQVGSRARISVADQGPGLAEADQARVFDKFERLGRSGDGGSGLGLYISRRLARAMGGELSVESQAGKGARFVLEVPADQAS